MPFLREIRPADGVRAGIWKINETADELLAQVQLSIAETILYKNFHHELRKCQWLAYRALLKHLLTPLTTTLSYDLHGKPFLDSGSHHLSVSHAGEFAAVVCSKNTPVGIDIEKMKDRVDRVKERFLREDELESIAPGHHLEQLYVFWGGKEAIYKLNGAPGVDFRNDIHIHPFDYLCNTNQNCKATLTFNGFRKDYSLYFQTIGDYMMVVAF
jgi:4'-phosphopantetheinyl transferase